ncbi:hypothetical protein H3H39_26165 [Duganella sp. LX47W]|uniref:Uncharacterized protein n=1 Tax=Rugamonas apoptosis TaxID=2758570 RepID=A0A7W2INH8_9BURK|nr:hypothetical protein [Rugamonas apoptosis]
MRLLNGSVAQIPASGARVDARVNRRDARTAKPKYQTTNWKEYNAALKARGSLLV